MYLLFILTIYKTEIFIFILSIYKNNIFMYVPYLIFNNLLSRFTSYFVIKDEIYLKTIMFTLLPTQN